MNFPNWLVHCLWQFLSALNTSSSFHSSCSTVFIASKLIVITALSLGRLSTRSLYPDGLNQIWILPFPRKSTSRLSLANDHTPSTTTPDVYWAHIWCQALLWAFVYNILTPCNNLVRRVYNGSHFPRKGDLKTQNSVVPNGKPVATKHCVYLCGNKLLMGTLKFMASLKEFSLKVFLQALHSLGTGSMLFYISLHVW